MKKIFILLNVVIFTVVLCGLASAACDCCSCFVDDGQGGLEVVADDALCGDCYNRYVTGAGVTYALTAEGTQCETDLTADPALCDPLEWECCECYDGTWNSADAACAEVSVAEQEICMNSYADECLTECCGCVGDDDYYTPAVECPDVTGDDLEACDAWANYYLEQMGTELHDGKGLCPDDVTVDCCRCVGDDGYFDLTNCPALTGTEREFCLQWASYELTYNAATDSYTDDNELCVVVEEIDCCNCVDANGFLIPNCPFVAGRECYNEAMVLCTDLYSADVCSTEQSDFLYDTFEFGAQIGCPGEIDVDLCDNLEDDDKDVRVEIINVGGTARPMVISGGIDMWGGCDTDLDLATIEIKGFTDTATIIQCQEVGGIIIPPDECCVEGGTEFGPTATSFDTFACADGKDNDGDRAKVDIQGNLVGGIDYWGACELNTLILTCNRYADAADRATDAATCRILAGVETCEDAGGVFIQADPKCLSPFFNEDGTVGLTNPYGGDASLLRVAELTPIDNPGFFQAIGGIQLPTGIADILSGAGGATSGFFFFWRD
ncbi:hypothetical protein HOD38_00465 [archaeon]|jgi:hypothetical protein|nr:hypothetical protein [archaeon]MBT4396719.1 hypothetical protein [archaeon]MBT4441329.1 hypothetical protein [archaeon]